MKFENNYNLKGLLEEAKLIETDGKVVELKTTSKIRFTVEKLVYEKPTLRGTIHKRVALIILKDDISKLDLVHPFTDYVITEISKLSIKTQIDYSWKIVKFLNYILDNNARFEINNFTKLKYYHASSFINEYCGDLSRETALGYKNIIAKFYYFLAKKAVLEYCHKNDFTETKVEVGNGRIINVVEAPFQGLEIPEAKVKSKNEHDIDVELQALMLEIAYEEVNCIALGVALQLFGGLRLSEVVRCRYSLIRTFGYFGEDGIMIILKDDDEGTRPDLKNNGGKGYVKRQRVQQTKSPNGLISELLKQHNQKYKDKSGGDAVFINADGRPMSYESYIYYFNKLKKKFLERLSKSDNPIMKSQSVVLKASRWSTHIGRGMFTNNLVESAENPIIVQMLRGDLDPRSVYVYISNSKRLGLKYEENTENTYSALLNKFNGGN